MASYLMVLPVLRRIHCGIGRFCFCALASFCLVRKDLWLCKRIRQYIELLRAAGERTGIVTVLSCDVEGKKRCWSSRWGLKSRRRRLGF